MRSIRETIFSEARRFSTFYRHGPDYCYLGRIQMAEIQTMIAELEKFGFIVKCVTTVANPTLDGIELIPVNLENHLSFGYKQPSPCG